MEQEKMDFAKILAMLSQPKEAPAPLENVEKRRIEIPYITGDNKVELRPIQLFIPKEASKPMPLVYVAHYEIGEDSVELRSYLAKGWAVSSVTEFDNKYNGRLVDDDLVFNNAALYTLRNLPEIDRRRIAVVGGSAGGYMALMLNAMQLGICCSVTNAPITNLYFNMYWYSNETNRINRQALEELSQEKHANFRENPLDFMESMSKLPLPFLGALSGVFGPIREHFPKSDDLARWEAFSPVALTELFCNPVMLNHFTSDVLVPIDQISKRFTYDKPGASLPEDFCHRLPENIAGKLGCSLEERLPEEETRTECLQAVDANENYTLPFDPNKRFNLNLFDEGPVEGYASHRIQPGTGRADDIPYLEEMFMRTAAKTNVLTTEKLRLLLERYQGNSVQLPAHEGVNDKVYGSLEIYRQEVREELANWIMDNGRMALQAVFEALLEAEENITCRENLQNTMKSINEFM